MKKLYAALICSIVAGGASAQVLRQARLMKTAAPPVHAATPVHQTERGASIWSDDFSNPSNWTMGGPGTHSWVIGNTPPTGAYAIDTINSTTAANGWALYDSDLYNGPSDNAWIQNANPIDLSGHPAVQLRFEEYYRKFRDQTFVEVSTDGTNFTSIEVNSQVQVNEFGGGSATANPNTVTIPISALAGNQSTVYIRFRFTSTDGADYSWQVDDVSISAIVGNNISMVNAELTPYNDYATTTWDSLPYSIYPITELRPLGLTMKYTNNGATAEDATGTITTSDGYSESGTANIGLGDTATFLVPGVGYTPTATVGTYTVNYSVAGTNTDTDTSDNALSKSFKVSNGIYGLDQGGVAYALDDSAGVAFKVANGFYVNVDELLVSIDVAFAPNSATGVDVGAMLLDPNTTNFDPIVESPYHVLEASDLSAVGEETFVSFVFDPPYQLTAGTDYLAAIQHFGGAEVKVAGAENIPVKQTCFIFRSSRNDWFYLGDATPMIRMHFATPIGIMESDMQNGVGLGQNHPNPANASTTVTYSLNNSAKVNMDLFDINGKLVRNLVQGTMAPGEHRLDISTADLQDGVYFYTLTTDGAVSTKRMTVVH